MAAKVIDAAATRRHEPEWNRAAAQRGASCPMAGAQAALADRLVGCPRVTHVLPSELEANEMLASMSKLFRESGAGDPT